MRLCYLLGLGWLAVRSPVLSDGLVPPPQLLCDCLPVVVASRLIHLALALHCQLGELSIDCRGIVRLDHIRSIDDCRGLTLISLVLIQLRAASLLQLLVWRRRGSLGKKCLRVLIRVIVVILAHLFALRVPLKME